MTDHKALIKMATNIILKNASDVVGFIVHDARRRLQAVEEPKYGRKYRRIVVAGLLDGEVDEVEGGIVLDIGVRQTSESKRHGLYIELGTKTDPPHPFLRPAIYENAMSIVELLTR